MGSSDRRLGYGERFAEAKRAAIGMPKPVMRMDEKPDRRGMDRFGALRPSLERQKRRAAKRKQRSGAEFARESLDQPPGSSGRADRRVRRSLRATRRSVPALAPGHARRARSCECRRARRPARSPPGARRRAERGPVRRMAANTTSTRRLSRRSSCTKATKRRSLYPPVTHLVYIRTILRRTPHGAKLELRADERGATAEPLIGRSLQRSHSRRVSRQSVSPTDPGNPDHQHAGPPSALICRAIERAAAKDGLTHLGRLTVNLFRPTPIGECGVEVATDYVGRNAGHYSGRFIAGGKECARFTALMQREDARLSRRERRAIRRQPRRNRPTNARSSRCISRTARSATADLVENRLAAGRFFKGPCAAWFRMNHPLVEGETPSAYQRVAVAGDSGNGISAALDFAKYVFINCDLTINLFRRPEGEWICLEVAACSASNGCGLAESALYDERGMIGRATQSLAVRAGDVRSAELHAATRPRCSSIGAKSRSSCSNEQRCSMQNVPMMMSAVLRIVIPMSRSLR